MGKKDIIVRSIAVIAIIFIASIGISHIRKPKKEELICLEKGS